MDVRVIWPAGNPGNPLTSVITALYCSLTISMPTDFHSQFKLLTPDELAEMLRISKTSVYRLVEQRKIPFYRLRGNLRFEQKDIMDFLRQNRVEPAGFK